MSFVTRILSRNLATKVDIKHVTVVGGGLMGSGIAQVRTIALCTLSSMVFWESYLSICIYKYITLILIVIEIHWYLAIKD